MGRVRLLFWALLVVFSFLCGAVFPALFASAGPDAPLESASVLDAMDHFGAIAGSLLTVMMFLPHPGDTGYDTFKYGYCHPSTFAKPFKDIAPGRGG